MSQKTETGRNNWIILMCLMMGIGIVLLIFVLKTKDEDVQPFSSGAELSGDASKVNLHKYSSDEIQKWIVTRMAAEKAQVGVVNIWATWCEPCRAEMPELAKYEKTKQAPLFLISADSELDERQVRSFLAQTGVDFESSIVKGDQQEFVERWQSLSSKDPARQWSMTLPATFLVNASGQIISFSVGTSTAAELSILVKKSLDTARD